MPKIYRQFKEFNYEDNMQQAPVNGNNQYSTKGGKRKGCYARCLLYTSNRNILFLSILVLFALNCLCSTLTGNCDSEGALVPVYIFSHKLSDCAYRQIGCTVINNRLGFAADVYKRQVLNNFGGYGIFTVCASTTPSGLALAPGLP